MATVKDMPASGSRKTEGEARDIPTTPAPEINQDAGSIPHPGGGFAKPSDAYSGGCIPQEPTVPEGEDAKKDSAAKK